MRLPDRITLTIIFVLTLLLLAVNTVKAESPYPPEIIYQSCNSIDVRWDAPDIEPWRISYGVVIIWESDAEVTDVLPACPTCPYMFFPHLEYKEYREDGGTHYFSTAPFWLPIGEWKIRGYWIKALNLETFEYDTYAVGEERFLCSNTGLPLVIK